MKSCLLNFFLIGIAHCIIGIWLYRARVMYHYSLLFSDFLVFALPAIVAFAIYFLVIWRSEYLVIKPWLRVVSTVCLSFLATLGSFVISIIIAFNKYGT